MEADAPMSAHPLWLLQRLGDLCQCAPLSRIFENANQRPWLRSQRGAVGRHPSARESREEGSQVRRLALSCPRLFAQSTPQERSPTFALSEVCASLGASTSRRSRPMCFPLPQALNGSRPPADLDGGQAHSGHYQDIGVDFALWTRKLRQKGQESFNGLKRESATD